MIDSMIFPLFSVDYTKLADRKLAMHLSQLDIFRSRLLLYYSYIHVWLFYVCVLCANNSPVNAYLWSACCGPQEFGAFCESGRGGPDSQGPPIALGRTKVAIYPDVYLYLSEPIIKLRWREWTKSISQLPSSGQMSIFKKNCLCILWIDRSFDIEV